MYVYGGRMGDDPHMQAGDERWSVLTCVCGVCEGEGRCGRFIDRLNQGWALGFFSLVYCIDSILQRLNDQHQSRGNNKIAHLRSLVVLD